MDVNWALRSTQAWMINIIVKPIMHASMWPTSTHSVNWTVKLEYRLGRFADWNPLYFISLILFFFRQSRHVFQSMQWSQLRMESYFRSCGMFWAQGNVFCTYVVFWIIAGGMLLFSSNWFEWLCRYEPGQYYKAHHDYFADEVFFASNLSMSRFLDLAIRKNKL
jgi:hypothetical protein